MFNAKPTNGLYLPEDNSRKAYNRLVEAVRQTVKILSEGGVAPLAQPQLTQALAPEVFRMVLHEGLIEE